MTTVQSGSRTSVNVNGTAVEMFSGGSGPPLVFFHGAGGSSGWQAYHEDLAANYTVYVPSQPGFNGTEGPGWAKTITDVALFNHMFIDALGLQNIVLMGSSMGGWVSAEMAAMDDHNIDALILVDAAGIKPVQGEIAEIFMVSADTRLQQRFHDPSQVENYEHLTRELTPRRTAGSPLQRHHRLSTLLAAIPEQPEPSPYAGSRRHANTDRLGPGRCHHSR